MRILAAGGGSGGHVTPVVAVLKEIRAQHPRAELGVWCDPKFAPQAQSVVNSFDPKIKVHSIVGGKFRRYNHLTVWQQLTWPSLVFKNLRDVFLVIAGFFQSLIKLIIWRPDVLFAKGGYVCLPIGAAAHVLRIPIVIHDSDAHPGLTNRVLSKWASYIATGAPLEYYDYPPEKARYVGIPIGAGFHPYDAAEQRVAKLEWGIAPDRPLIVVTGGGLGAKRINDTVAEVLTPLLQIGSVVLVAGAGQYDELRALLPADSAEFQLYPFVNNMDSLLGAADVVVTRAGATTILELAALEKPTVLIPNAQLTGGHQLKNAVVYEEARAVVVLDEATIVNFPHLLVEELQKLLDDPKATVEMAKRFGKFAKPHAASDVASMVLSAVRK